MVGPLWDGITPKALSDSFPTRYVGKRLLYFSSTTSTQDIAKEEAAMGCPEGTLVLADEQSQGRGRFQRTWVSPTGGALLLSLVLRPDTEMAAALPIAVSLAAARAVRLETGLPAVVKWPNDIQIAGRKLAGILIDAAGSDNGVDYAVIGIGLNVGLDPSAHPDIAAIATSLSREAGKPVARRQILASLLREIEELYEATREGRALVPEWRQYLVTLGQRVRVVWPGAAGGPVWEEEGVAEDVNEQGSLLLRRADGSVVALSGGEVSLRG